MEEEYLKQIVQNTSTVLKPSFQIVLTGNGSRLSSTFSPPLDLHVGCKYEVALTSLETYYAIPNIDKTNNEVKVLIKKKLEEILIPVGCYELTGINKELERQIVSKGGKKRRCHTYTKFKYISL